jgi:SAM-dependent methyltransferase
MDRLGSSEKAQRDIRREMELRDADADGYDAWYLSRGAWWHLTEASVLLKMLNPGLGDAVLDAGCGTGRLAMLVAPRVARLDGVDHSARSLEVLSSRAFSQGFTNVRTHRADLTKLPFTGDAFDKVLCVQALQHVPSASLRRECLGELKRVLRPGGRLVVSVYRWGGAVLTDKEGYWSNGLYRYAFTQPELHALLEECGYVDVRVLQLLNVPLFRRLRGCQRLTSALDASFSFAGFRVGRGVYLAATASKPANG